jgi:hypothetical protein
MLRSLFFLLTIRSEARAMDNIVVINLGDVKRVVSKVGAGIGSSRSGIGLFMAVWFLSSLCIDTVPAGLRRGDGTGGGCRMCIYVDVNDE